MGARAASTELLVVLDLDETLVHATEAPLARPPDLRVCDHDVYLRPGVRRFLAHVRARFAVGVWTSSGADYASAMVEALFGPSGPQFVFDRRRCTPRRDLETQELVWLKDIRKLRSQGFPRSRIVFVDDSPEKLVRSYGNLVRVSPFEGDPGDRELERLARYLDEVVAPAENVRAIDKRGWRARYEG